MKKAIYGLAMPFDDSYVDYIPLFNQYEIERTNKESVQLDTLVGATVEHNYIQELGRTDRNLDICVTDDGVFFRIIPDTKLGHSTYKKVSNGSLKYCSISYTVRKKKRDYKSEEKLSYLSKSLGWKDNFIVFKYAEILVFEICVTNNPANRATFCTTNKNDLRLRGVKWND
ncbi:HK97 family phage prohead protease [Virgibacillus sp. SK37]|uniref:HK97 family phage prohead protease n=1 Tax=Virgibacillus sp. SK37 TaxID=403957 RepID=UPI00119D7FF6|nr:HK97 family phage prohead protease [Virgibacillus sp. SK37]